MEPVVIQVHIQVKKATAKTPSPLQKQTSPWERTKRPLSQNQFLQNTWSKASRLYLVTPARQWAHSWGLPKAVRTWGRPHT